MSSSVISESEPHLTVDPQRLERLCADLDGDTEAVTGFISAFVRMWPARLDRVRGAVHRNDVEAILDSALSIRSSSGMIGAAQLGAVAVDVERCGRRGDVTGAHALIPRLSTAGSATVTVLSEMLVAGRY
ncbi:Hpt domain-containing protein [Paramicrobacterium agarici]|uniref:Hpt domain-containing protein n=1 Tax=Paramicrobacterium agarici TaxID=630514 RepID=A0A2A9DWC6_9MICO|nr:Hpt domain-containing protein [Microbacterium agarici]PFG30651.1 Hpt domain-containing protein [Microbacterium agarici]